MIGQYDLDDLMEMSMPEVYEAIKGGHISLDVFCDYENRALEIAYMHGVQEAQQAPKQ